MRRTAGFTLLEVILVICMLGLLSVIALPKFVSISTLASHTAMDYTAASVRDGIRLYSFNSMITAGDASHQMPPPDLEEGACCFGRVLAYPVPLGWSTSDNIHYLYNQHAVAHHFTYDSDTGQFDQDD